jgi:hypothetical protein
MSSASKMAPRFEPPQEQLGFAAHAEHSGYKEPAKVSASIFLICTIILIWRGHVMLDYTPEQTYEERAINVYLNDSNMKHKLNECIELAEKADIEIATKNARIAKLEAELAFGRENITRLQRKVEEALAALNYVAKESHSA